MSEYVELTQEQKDWFANRMDESATGCVKVPAYLYSKFRKIADNECILNATIKTVLIDECYNQDWH